jgi:hypothetical protein
MVENLKDLEKLLKLLRKQGVTEVQLQGGQVTSVKLGDLPLKQSEVMDSEEMSLDPLEGFPEGELTPEELTFFANGGLPEDNPYRNKN